MEAKLDYNLEWDRFELTVKLFDGRRLRFNVQDLISATQEVKLMSKPVATDSNG
jgi:hypothetical protein